MFLGNIKKKDGEREVWRRAIRCRKRNNCACALCTEPMALLKPWLIAVCRNLEHACSNTSRSRRQTTACAYTLLSPSTISFWKRARQFLSCPIIYCGLYPNLICLHALA
jgi:hypothetical protein